MLNLTAYVLSCKLRDELRQSTIDNLRQAGWSGNLTVELDNSKSVIPLERHTQLVRRTLRRAVKEEQDIFLLLEDDLQFNRHLLHNLSNWRPLQHFVPGTHFYASLYNPGVSIVKSVPKLGYGEALTSSVIGMQALLLSRTTASYILTSWGVESCAHADVRLARLAGRVCPLLYHLPSLVQHVGVKSMWGGPFHCATDFDVRWRAGGEY